MWIEVQVKNRILGDIMVLPTFFLPCDTCGLQCCALSFELGKEPSGASLTVLEPGFTATYCRVTLSYSLDLSVFSSFI
jgi:hypothetical protein